MPIVIEQTIQALQAVVQGVPVGTNLALLHLMWAILNGSFLGSRGAIFPALQASGFGEQESRRSWQALRYGAWDIGQLLEAWRAYVHQQGDWHPHRYCPVPNSTPKICPSRSAMDASGRIPQITRDPTQHPQSLRARLETAHGLDRQGMARDYIQGLGPL